MDLFSNKEIYAEQKYFRKLGADGNCFYAGLMA
jgi:hypothetical protein